jgi:chorismate-pyruvate lyase
LKDALDAAQPIAELIDADLIFQSAPPAAKHLWARRFRFTFESGDLLVTEIFFPGVLDLLSQ